MQSIWARPLLAAQRKVFVRQSIAPYAWTSPPSLQQYTWQASAQLLFVLFPWAALTPPPTPPQISAKELFIPSPLLHWSNQSYSLFAFPSSSFHYPAYLAPLLVDRLCILCAPSQNPSTRPRTLRLAGDRSVFPPLIRSLSASIAMDAPITFIRRAACLGVPSFHPWGGHCTGCHVVCRDLPRMGARP